MPTCHVIFEPDECYHLLDTRLNSVVDTLLLNRFLESNEEFRWCKSTKGCGAGQLLLFDAERALNPDLASDVTVLAFTKQCPNTSCRKPIMTFEGCDVMTCCRFGTHACVEAKGKYNHGGQSYCGQRFCWKYLGKIDSNKSTGAYVRHCDQSCEYAKLNNQIKTTVFLPDRFCEISHCTKLIKKTLYSGDYKYR